MYPHASLCSFIDLEPQIQRNIFNHLNYESFLEDQSSYISRRINFGKKEKKIRRVNPHRVLNKTKQKSIKVFFPFTSRNNKSTTYSKLLSYISPSYKQNNMISPVSIRSNKI